MADRFDVATRKGLFRYERTHSGWKIAQRTFIGFPVTLTLTTPHDNATYAALDHGHFGIKVHRCDTGSFDDFQEIAAPTYPPKPDDAPSIKNPNTGVEIPWTLKLIWALETGGSDRPERIWCGTAPGGLFHSDDRGETWHLNEALWNVPEREFWAGGGYDYPAIHSICVDPRNPHHLALAISTAGVWFTEDDGQTWSCPGKGMRAEYMPPEMAFNPVAQDVHRLARCPASPDTLWVQHHNGIFRSTDNGRNWTKLTDVKPSAFGFPVVAHPTDANTAWFVPAKKDEFRIPVDGQVVVTRTTDGGKTFQAFTNGLPQQDAYDIVFRHALDLDPTGTQLVIGSTTGNLWISDDSGESWTNLSNHLPPIHAVRFL